MPNYDEKTVIHYGVISPHSIRAECIDDWQTCGTDPYYEAVKEELIRPVREHLSKYGLSIGEIDEVLDPLIEIYNNSYEDQYGVIDYEDADYTIHVAEDSFGVFIIKSPYYTFCRPCSPCAPGAGDLDNPAQIDRRYKRDNPLSGYGSALKTYCLPAEFFDSGYPDFDPDKPKVPYAVYRVDNDQVVTPEKELSPVIEVD